MMNLIKIAAAATLALSATIASAETHIQGGGATFPNPLYQKWVNEFQKSMTDVKVDYNSQGSGFGIKGLTAKTLDFAGSDAPMSKKELEEAKGDVIHIPTCAGGVVPAYNLAGVTDLKLDGKALAEIYMGKITKWNDPSIKKLNEGVTLPDKTITPVYRTDGSGTTFVFTSYLATQSSDFEEKIGKGKSVDFPTGQGGKGSAGVAAAVKSTDGAIGYVESNYATQNNISFAAMMNKNGKFVKGSPETVAAAGASAVDQMKDGKLDVDIWNQPGDNAYPISAFTYIIVYKDLNNVADHDKAKALVGFLNWAITDGQKMATAMDYAPLAPEVAEKAKSAIAGLTHKGMTLAAK